MKNTSNILGRRGHLDMGGIVLILIVSTIAAWGGTIFFLNKKEVSDKKIINSQLTAMNEILAEHPEYAKYIQGIGGGRAVSYKDGAAIKAKLETVQDPEFIAGAVVAVIKNDPSSEAVFLEKFNIAYTKDGAVLTLRQPKAPATALVVEFAGQ